MGRGKNAHCGRRSKPRRGGRPILACQLGRWPGRVGRSSDARRKHVATEWELSHDHRPEVILQSGDGWYTEPHYRFDIGFITDLSEPARVLTISPRR
jgi:hypothetical protein